MSALLLYFALHGGKPNPPIRGVRPSCIFRGGEHLKRPPLEEKVVCLTFDDGPDSRLTPSLLETLKKYNAKATFFLVGQLIPHNTALLKRMVAEGHQVADHSMTHPMRPSVASADREVNGTNDRIEAALGFRTQYYRPPYGIMTVPTTKLARKQGMYVVLWSVDTNDWRTKDWKKVHARACRVDPGDIVLMHDIHASTVKAVPAILETLSKRGYQFITVEEMTKRWTDRLAELAKTPPATTPSAVPPASTVKPKPEPMSSSHKVPGAAKVGQPMRRITT